MIPYPVPPELQGLTQIEEMLIAHAIPIMRVYIKPGKQTQEKKHFGALKLELTVSYT